MTFSARFPKLNIASSKIPLSFKHSRRWQRVGLLQMGRRIFGMEFVIGLSLLPSPPARINAFIYFLTLSLIAFIWAGVLPQQAPTMFTPNFTYLSAYSAIFSGVASNTVFPSTNFGTPALG